MSVYYRRRIQKTLKKHDNASEDIQWTLKDIQGTLKDIQVTLQSLDDRVSRLGSELRDLRYKVEDLDDKFRRHEKAHQFSEEDELYEEPTPALGGIAGAVSPTGRFMRW